jgi:hypothetical protein
MVQWQLCLTNKEYRELTHINMTNKFEIWNTKTKRFVDANDLCVLDKDGQLLNSATMLAAKKQLKRT